MCYCTFKQVNFCWMSYISLLYIFFKRTYWKAYTYLQCDTLHIWWRRPLRPPVACRPDALIYFRKGMALRWLFIFPTSDVVNYCLYHWELSLTILGLCWDTALVIQVKFWARHFLSDNLLYGIYIVFICGPVVEQHEVSNGVVGYWANRGPHNAQSKHAVAVFNHWMVLLR